ncbi:hypothetical protein [Candidatus Williamhamiltonella defendens]|nr:hypothetical protein [Candidatus Hamiltonella defensa]
MIKSLVEKIQVHFHPNVTGQFVFYTLNDENKIHEITFKITDHKN